MSEKEEQMIQTIHYLSETIGSRGSCSDEQRRAGEYIGDELHRLGGKEIKIEPFSAIPSTYWPYALAFAAAFVGSILGLAHGGWVASGIAAILNALGAWGFIAETDLASSWTRWLLHRTRSQNLVGKVPPAGEKRYRAVLCAHLDTHRTPIFYSSNAWQSIFTALLGLALVSMVTGAVAFGLEAIFDWDWIHWLGVPLILIQGFALAMSLHADRTPYSPGANDNASGVAVTLAVASQLQETPLENTEVHFVFTDCEEAGDQGMEAFLNRHAAELGEDAFYIIIDQVGAGRIKFLTADGLIIKHPTHPRSLELARKVAVENKDLEAIEGVGLAYTDALKATKRGLIALTLCAVPQDGSGAGAHWHQMSDTLVHIRPEDLEKSFSFTWEVLRALDQPGE